MNKKALKERLNCREWEDFEAKEAKNSVPKDIWKTVGAFANTEGGHIVLGIMEQEDGQLTVSGVKNIEKVQNDFISTLRGEKFNIQLSSRGHIFDFEGKKVLLFKINAMPRSCKPIYYGGDIRSTYIRRGNGDHKCSKEEINRMLREASEFSSDSMILDGFNINDVDSESITVYKKYLSFRNPESLFIPMADESFLKKLGCLKINRERDNKAELTMAGLLLFGKEDSIRERFPAYELDIYLVPRDDVVAEKVRWNDRQIYETNLIKTYLEAIQYMKNKIEIPFALSVDNITRTEEVPAVISIREALVNMLIHRDYFENGQSSIRIYRDRIDMFNPGSSPKTVEEIIEDDVTVPRNPVIAKIFRLIGWAEVAGGGMLKIFKNWRFAGYVEPEIINNVPGYYFKMIFPLESRENRYEARESLVAKRAGIDLDEPVRLSGTGKKIIDKIRQNRYITYEELAKALRKDKTTVFRYLQKLKENFVIERIGSNKIGHWIILREVEDSSS